MSIDEMIAKTEAALAAATDPAKQERLSSRLASFKLTKLRAEKPDDDGDEDDDDEAGKHAKKAAEHKAKSESEKHKAKAAEFRQKAAEADEKAKAAEGGDEEEEAEESKAALALIQQHTGLTGAAAIGSAAAMFGQVAEHDKAIKAMQAKAVADERASLVASVSKMTTKAEREMLADWPLKQVRSFVETRMKSGLVHTEDSSLVKAKVIVPGSEDSLIPEALAMIDIACQHFPGTEAERTEFRKAQVAAHTAAHQKALAPALNGAAGRL